MDDRILKKALGYRRFTGQPRTLILDTGYLMVRDVIHAAEDLGWHSTSLPTPREGTGEGEFVGRLLMALATERPDFVVTINHLGFDEVGVLAGLLDRYQIPTASWFVDHPLAVLGGAPGNVTSCCKVFCFERTALPWLARMGYTDPVYLPTASNQRIYHPSVIDRDRAAALSWPLTFVGNSWWIKARQEPAAWVREGVKALGRIQEVNRSSLDGMEQNLSKVPLSGVEASHPRARYAVAAAALAEASMERRGSMARALQPLGLRVHGDPAWEQLVPGIDVRGYLDYERELPALFSSCAVNANVTAEQMPTAVNQRVWDVPGVRSFLLTDAQEDALEFFDEDHEIVVYRDFEEAADKARHYLQHEEARLAIAARAHQKVEQAHRFTHRLRRMAEVMRDSFG